MQLTLGNDGRELKSHGDFAFPLLISPERLSAYEMNSFALHWHPEMEFTLILDGEILYQVNDQTFHLQEGDAVFCNSNMLHTGRPVQNHGDCRYLSITVKPSLLYGYETSLLQTKYIAPITENPLFPALPFYRQNPQEREVLNTLKHIWELWKHPGTAYELELLTSLYQIWIRLYEQLDLTAQPSARDIRELERLRSIITYVHEHYMDRITLDDISGAVSMCKSECCRLFKRNMHQSLFDYLLHYRIRQSIPLLRSGQDTITEISFRCGFSSPSYYTKLFRSFMGCTPREYAARARSSSF